MIEDLTNDAIDLTPGHEDTTFSEDFDFGSSQAGYQAGAEQWRRLSKQEKGQFGDNLEAYLKSKGIENPRYHPSFPQVKNLHLLRSEIKAQVDSDKQFQLLGIEEFNANSSLLQLLEHMENTTHIRDIYRRRKLTTGRDAKSGISEEQARVLRNCMRQGRDLFLSGQNGSLMIKPLVWFYSLTAYSFACIILNSPIRYSLETLPSSHGLNYLPDNLTIQFGGSIKQGTFSELFTAFPTSHIQNSRIAFTQSLEESILAFQKTRFTSSCGTLMSLLPEMREFYSILTGKLSRAFPLDIAQIPDGRGTKWEFQIGDGQQRPDQAILDQAFSGHPKTERQGRVIVTVSPAEIHKTKALIYTDARGRFWYIDNPFFPVLLPEIGIHFLLANAFSNIMRYKPGVWGDILLNETTSDLALLVRKYFSTFETKVPLLLLRHLSQFMPYIDPEA